MGYKVVIPSAGMGSRIGPYTKFMNKALVTINNKPAICHIIEQFPDAEEFVICVGYKGAYIKQVVRAFYPRKKIRFVDVDVYQGPESGLGHTLLCAKEFLQCPFIFISNDTVIPHEKCNYNPRAYGNWMGYTIVDGDTTQYRTLDVHDNRVMSINPKGVIQSPNAYIGIAGINDWETFWSSMGCSRQSVAVGESFGMKSLDGIKAFEFKSWCDIGNMESLAKTRATLNDDKFNILEKEDEAIWFHDGKVFKFSVSEAFIADRVARLGELPPTLFPKVTHCSANVYSYPMVEGDVIGKHFNVPTMLDVLNRVNCQLWEPNKQASPSPELIRNCYMFYRTKTYDRVQLFHNKFEVLDQDEMINGQFVPQTSEMLNKIQWSAICEDPYATAFHGDFHNENILIDIHNNPILIDWRQNFGLGLYDIGDAYYDFAKYYHGLIVSHHMVSGNHFKVNHLEKDVIEIDIHRPMSLVEGEAAYVKWLEEHNIDVPRVRVLTALIFLNIAALHEFPYSMFLYYLGKHLLLEWGKDYEHCEW